MDGVWRSFVRDRLLSTLWFLPSLLVLFSAVLAAAMVELSAHVDHEVLQRFPRLFGASAESSRGMLAAIAGSMITVAGVTFSITMVVITQASAQYTPRILRNFMRDRPSQLVLGGLSGVFTYCLVVLRTIRGGEEGYFVPSIAVVVGFVLAVVGISLLIYFVHHVTSALQASSIVSRVTEDALRAVDRLFPSEVGQPADGATAHPVGVIEAGSLAWTPVPSPRRGYVQRVDADALLSAAREHDTVVRMDCAVGDFVVGGAPLASVAARAGADSRRQGDAAPEAVARAVARAFELGPQRTVEQDAAYGVQQLVDIALRALSPSVNDPTTAVTAIDYLGAVLVYAAGRADEPLVRREDGVLRVIARGTSFEQLLEGGIHAILRYAEGHVAVLGRLVGAVAIIAMASRDPSRREAVLRQLEHLEEVIGRTVPAPVDRSALEELVRDVRHHSVSPSAWA